MRHLAGSRKLSWCSSGHALLEVLLAGVLVAALVVASAEVAMRSFEISACMRARQTELSGLRSAAALLETDLRRAVRVEACSGSSLALDCGESIAWETTDAGVARRIASGTKFWPGLAAEFRLEPSGLVRACIRGPGGKIETAVAVVGSL